MSMLTVKPVVGKAAIANIATLPLTRNRMRLLHMKHPLNQLGGMFKHLWTLKAAMCFSTPVRRIRLLIERRLKSASQKVPS